MNVPKPAQKRRLVHGRRFGALVASLAVASIVLIGCGSPEEQDLIQPSPDQPPAVDVNPGPSGPPVTPPSTEPPAQQDPPADKPPATLPGTTPDPDTPPPDDGQDDDGQDDDASPPGDG